MDTKCSNTPRTIEQHLGFNITALKNLYNKLKQPYKIIKYRSERHVYYMKLNTADGLSFKHL